VFGHTKRNNINNEREQCLYPDRHEAIITVGQFEAAQLLLSNLEKGIHGYSAAHVIDAGMFRGYVPVNHKWMNDNPNVYFEASNSVDRQAKSQQIRKDFLCRFNLAGFQVVRGHFLTARQESPCITVTENRLSFNSSVFASSQVHTYSWYPSCNARSPSALLGHTSTHTVRVDSKNDQ
jgi:hypothetical protein